MTDLEQQILDIIQDGFPVVERPYAAIAETLSSPASNPALSSPAQTGDLADQSRNDISAKVFSEQQVFDAVENLRASGVIRRIGGVYDSKKLGYTSHLCCGIVPEKTDNGGESPIDRFAAVVNEIPAITHNYVRSHKYNVWFTVIGTSEQEIRNVVCNLERETALTDTHILKANRMFKINTVMRKRKVDSLQSSPASMAKFSPLAQSENLMDSCKAGRKEKVCGNSVLGDFDRARIHALSGDLPHTLTPFADVAEQVGGYADVLMLKQTQDEVINGVLDDLSSRRMRRFGAILRHQQAGFAENAMTCFKFSSDLVPAMGSFLAEEPFVSHCYDRDSFEGFDYNVYAMVHGNSLDDLNAKIQSLVKKTGATEYVVLRSLRELKKTSFRF